MNPPVSSVMLRPGSFPIIQSDTIFQEALESMTRYSIGVACVVNSSTLVGIFTDGDIRRTLLSFQKPLSALFVDDAITYSAKQPITVDINADLKSAVQLMEEYKIWDLPVVDSDNVLVGLLHLHPAIKSLLE